MSKNEEDSSEFMIAADLTLYDNPLRRVMQKPKVVEDKVTPGTPGTPPGTSGIIKPLELKRDEIAADLNRYDCPLDNRLTKLKK